MEFNKDEAAVHASSVNVEAGSRAVGEIDLYDELISFAELSPEEQRLVARPKKPAEEAPLPNDVEPVSTQPAIKPIEAETTEPAAESVPDFEEPGERAEASDPSQELFDRSRTGALLAGLNVVPDFVFTGDLSGGACLACGSESGADDLFCLSCGVFIDNIGSTPAVNPTCGECGQSVAADEIFCPWCGAAPAA